MSNPVENATKQASIEQHLDGLRTASERCSEATLQNHRASLGEVHLMDLDIATWLERITGPETQQLQAARRELALAEYTASSGLYRQAFAGLRLFLELSFAAVHFSVNELERRQWISDRIDFSWSRALDEETGVLSRQFVVEFAPQAKTDAERYATIASKCYRHCSQFVHGKAKTSANLPSTIEYRDAVTADWCDNARQAGDAVLFLLYIRYGNELDINKDAALNEIMMQRFGHLLSVRALLQMAED